MKNRRTRTRSPILGSTDGSLGTGRKPEKSDSKKRFFLNESFVKRTITNLDNIVEKQITAGKRK